MRIFVTGGSGFLGGHVIEQLSRDHEVLAMARSDKSADAVRGFGATPVRSALNTVDPTSLAGVDAIVHCAAFVDEWGPRDAFWRANVEGTEQLLEAARAAGVKRFVHVSTVATLFDGRPLDGVDEAAPYPRRHRYLYGETKQAAEERVLAANGEMTTVALRPCFIWGPRDTTLMPAVERMVDAGSWAWLDKGRAVVSTTHVLNLVHAIRLALDPAGGARGGQAYFVADGRDRSLREFISTQADERGVTMPKRSLPGALARGLAWTLEGVYRLLRVKRIPPITRMGAALMSRSVTVDDGKARRELGYAPVVTV